MSRNPKYRRVLLKLSGQGLMGEKAFGFDSGTMERIATEVRGVHDMGVQICLVIGGWVNIAIGVGHLLARGAREQTSCELGLERGDATTQRRLTDSEVPGRSG